MLTDTLTKHAAKLDTDSEKKKKIEQIVQKMSDFFIEAEKSVASEKTGSFYTREDYQAKIAHQLGIPFDLQKNKSMSIEEKQRSDEQLLKQYKEKTGKDLLDLSFSLTPEEILEKKIPKAPIGCTGTAKLFCYFAQQVGLECSVVITSSLSDLKQSHQEQHFPVEKRGIINGHQVIGVQFSDGFHVFDPGAFKVKDTNKSQTDLDNLEMYPKYFKGPSKIGDVDYFLKDRPCQIRAIVTPEVFNQVKSYQALANLQTSGNIHDNSFKNIPRTVQSVYSKQNSRI